MVDGKDPKGGPPSLKAFPRGHHVQGQSERSAECKASPKSKVQRPKLVAAAKPVQEKIPEISRCFLEFPDISTSQGEKYVGMEDG